MECCRNDKHNRADYTDNHRYAAYYITAAFRGRRTDYYGIGARYRTSVTYIAANNRNGGYEHCNHADRKYTVADYSSITAAYGAGTGLVAALPVLIEALPEIITAIINALVEGIPLIIESAGDIIVALIDGIIDAIPLLIAAIPQIIAAIVTGLITGLPKILTAAGKLVTTIINKIKELPTLIPQAIAAGVEKIAEWGANMQEKAAQL